MENLFCPEEIAQQIVSRKWAAVEKGRRALRELFETLDADEFAQVFREIWEHVIGRHQKNKVSKHLLAITGLQAIALLRDPDYLPTLDEIAAMKAEIRDGWSRGERRTRSTEPAWEVPACRNHRRGARR